MYVKRVCRDGVVGIGDEAGDVSGVLRTSFPSCDADHSIGGMTFLHHNPTSTVRLNTCRRSVSCVIFKANIQLYFVNRYFDYEKTGKDRGRCVRKCNQTKSIKTPN